MKRIIIDTDPGIDDALALLLAFSSPELKIEAITTVSGNVSQHKAHLNALKLLEFIGVKNVPVAMGAEKPLLREPMYAEEFHGISGLGDAVLPEPALNSDKRSALQLIFDKIEEFNGKLTLVAIGPLTNIAGALLLDAKKVEKIDELVIMGGAFQLTPYGHGNATPVAEFNIWHDPLAAKIVFDSRLRIKAVGLDVTTDPKNRLTKTAFSNILKANNVRTRLIADLCQRLVEKYDGMSLHDPMAIAVTVDESLAKTSKYKVEVETKSELTLGQTIIDKRRYSKPREEDLNVEICTSIDGERFLKMFMERIVME
ncbi:nucleoside hydrolase [Candidatus Bathyarchaeota archaeon]|nr:nucleoside hydrolase [Candidatus Bathyarchaeota archaeon]MBS7631029.1 nucleoside hydrolase [Candidatus Bathyarchaeota archaeon]